VLSSRAIEPTHLEASGLPGSDCSLRLAW
jgi:hypothetical protein